MAKIAQGFAPSQQKLHLLPFLHVISVAGNPRGIELQKVFHLLFRQVGVYGHAEMLLHRLPLCVQPLDGCFPQLVSQFRGVIGDDLGNHFVRSGCVFAPWKYKLTAAGVNLFGDISRHLLEQLRAGSEVGGASRRGDELLHRTY